MRLPHARRGPRDRDKDTGERQRPTPVTNIIKEVIAPTPQVTYATKYVRLERFINRIILTQQSLKVPILHVPKLFPLLDWF